MTAIRKGHGQHGDWRANKFIHHAKQLRGGTKGTTSRFSASHFDRVRLGRITNGVQFNRETWPMRVRTVPSVGVCLPTQLPAHFPLTQTNLRLAVLSCQRAGRRLASRRRAHDRRSRSRRPHQMLHHACPLWMSWFVTTLMGAPRSDSPCCSARHPMASRASLGSRSGKSNLVAQSYFPPGSWSLRVGASMGFLP